MSKAQAAKAREDGYRRYLAEEAERKSARQVAYTAWVREDARLWRVVLAASTREKEAVARAAYKANLAAMPPLP